MKQNPVVIGNPLFLGEERTMRSRGASGGGMAHLIILSTGQAKGQKVSEYGWVWLGMLTAIWL